MKVAILVSGAPRLDNDCVPSLCRSIAGYSQIDLFYYLWQAEQLTTDKVFSTVAPALPRGCNVRQVELAAEYTHISSVQYTAYPETKAHNVFRMYKGIQGCDRLRRQAEFQAMESYHIVIRTRADVRVDSKIDLFKLRRATEDFIILPRNGHWRGGYCDQFAIGNGLAMSTYGSLIDYIDAYASSGIILHPETMLRYHFNQHALDALFGDFQVFIVRDTIQDVESEGSMPDKKDSVNG